MTMSFNDFVHSLRYEDIPDESLYFVRRCLLDLIGVAAAGSATPLSQIIREHALDHFGAGRKSARLLFDSRDVSPAGAALANATMIDSMDAHDGQKLTKGHVGCGVLPALLAFTESERKNDEREFLTSLLIGYELGSRAGIALHRTACDYHTSGAWVAVACAALGARTLGLDSAKTREAIGIAEYHGPRSQMMRAIDAPTMVKDGSGWGSMAGVSAAYLAAKGYTGAPSLTIESDEVADLWADLGERWYVKEQYFKPYPVCRWAQPAVEATLSLCREHKLSAEMIEDIEVTTFHEAKRLATALPKTTEEAQYSLPYPTAAALVYGALGPEQVSQSAFANPEVQRLASSMKLIEDEVYNGVFPANRIARVAINTKKGERFESNSTEARGDPEDHLSDTEIRDKFQHFTAPLTGESRARDIEKAVDELGYGNQMEAFLDLICAQTQGA
ncbi:MAG: MmgE/PrpD family protein [Gammaproteobacteria bacterium]|nr:MmgE/PrpD family protein [Gammaproteobacteria bacterium]